MTSPPASPLQHYVVAPTRIVWTSGVNVQNANCLLQNRTGQAVLSAAGSICILHKTNLEAGMLLDFGREIHGHVELFTASTGKNEPCPVRIRFGESVSEAMAELGGEKNTGNDHALRDQVVLLPWLGKKAVGPSGFRFVRIDAVDPDKPVHLTEVRAMLVLRDVPYLGSFSCDDDRLTKIWSVGAYTVHLNMQEYLWDGIKRDRLVWIGDMHPEVSTIHAVFGFNDVVTRSLDLVRDTTPMDQWMNGISSYSMWWVLIHHDLWMHHGNLDYLQAQQPYLVELLQKLARCVDKNGRETLDGFRFMDWPTAENPAAVHEGLQALLVLTLEAGIELNRALREQASVMRCRKAIQKLKGHRPGSGASKQSAALMVMAGLMEKNDGAARIKKRGPRELSTFFGYYVLEALAQCGETRTASDFISRYWGGMLDYGATTFWEDFDLAWTKNAGRIDELVPDGMRDLHGDFGAYCYKGFRHSLCHGWASGPTAWLSRHVLGVRPVAPGFAKVEILPQLGKLKWAEGSYPTPHGVIRVRHKRTSGGRINSDIQVPEGVLIVSPS